VQLSRRFARLAIRQCCYFAFDGGAGAHLLAMLAQQDARLRPVASPRHADLLLIIEPLGREPATVPGQRWGLE
jgi:hypothetical protein